MRFGEPKKNSRRAFLSGFSGLACLIATPAIARPSESRSPEFRLRMFNPRTEEDYDELVIEDNAITRSAIERFSYFARDWRENLTKPIDPMVILSAMKIQIMLERPEPIVLTSGYRCEKTNLSLAGTATNSLHIRGKALDIHHPGVSVNRLHRVAVALEDGGVGKYTSSGFVHIDSGRVRYWGS